MPTTTTYQIDPMTEARGWIADCWPTDEVDPDELSDDEVRAGVERHYCGGWSQFVAECCD